MGTRCADHVTPLYPQKLALTSPTGGGRSVGIVRVRTKATEFSFIVTTEIGVGISTRQLQDLLTNALSTLRTDIVTIIETNNSKFETECSNLRSDFFN